MAGSLLEFWQEHFSPGRIGLIHLDFMPAQIIGWGLRGLTPEEEPSPWMHCFMFLDAKDGIPRIAESDLSVPLPGFRKKRDGPQTNSVEKWSGETVDRACVLDAGIVHEQMIAIDRKVQELVGEGHKYGLLELVDTYLAIRRNDLTYKGWFHRAKRMHCGQFVRECLSVAGIDPMGARVRTEHSVPELFVRSLTVVGEWKLSD